WADPTYYWHYNNPDFQKLIAQADQTLDQTQYVDLMKQAAKILSTDAAGDFLWLLPSIIIATPDISGIPANAVTESFDLTAIASKSG
ncbi:MAG: ABC transporter substrate-binding protein, partial [Propionibacteriaceae bacterium]|nr:ABC transporter substrate-binding protein [Propionibacteriaceae bacterium]